ncbi:Translation initiation factor 3 subunit J component [Elasticomyces elasticus]|nr:Translation initiation factor 3 subunit J component [Elasticomyces elasticus]KAK4925107.1 Translation initiation factor 3 subunit J component [Elasticomyces elasticus]KAK5681679.1 Translation initiation factor 3 subunit J component [Elasticomyces elasticus]KAK5767593.1 Translation initiation factor 3 subunit J component [Elasticomyces elasticus]
MAPSKAPESWNDSDSDDTSSGDQLPSQAIPVSRKRFDDEEDDEDVLDDWEEAEDPEVEAEKAKKAEEAKAKAEAEAKALKKSKAQRVEEQREAHRKAKELLEDDESSEEEDLATRRARAAASEKESDLRNAEDLFGGAGGINPNRVAKPVTVLAGDDPSKAIDMSSLKLFSPATAPQFTQLRETLVPLLTANSKKPQYPTFLPEFVRQLCKELNSEQVKKVAAVLNTLSNEKMKDEKAADKGGKKSKAAKTKVALNASRDVGRSADTMAYDDGLEDDDFM